ncbi:MAG TPA: DUF2845 domain-containing protein [Polyangiaceae bacterium]|nr:DUF2845 domain-containing protein [Polyangiaceae bacterium]
MSQAQKNDYWVRAALLVVAGLSVSASARADSLSCDGRIVSTGDSRYDVKSICGEPDDASQRVEYRTVSGRVAGPCVRENGKLRCSQTREQVVEVVIDEWIYDFGKNRFIEYLTFEQGHLLSVREGSYGHKPPR